MVASGEGRMNFGTWKASTSTCQSTITARCTITMIAKDRIERSSSLNTVFSFWACTGSRSPGGHSIAASPPNQPSGWLGAQRMHHEVDHVLAAGLPGGRARQVLAEDRGQGRRVREVEIAQPCNRNIEMDRVDTLAEYAGFHPLAKDG